MSQKTNVLQKAGSFLFDNKVMVFCFPGFAGSNAGFKSGRLVQY